ncbi:hypothetical protein BAUCODRAFT_72725 [Baudoinia panamericana UAMH 10762]|uniref:Zn(2)-C6 fungal-type domain-containing protein n=1 Tax=Baudoinia panamericana (strain UAMH 10762) TaxID=717646 RepID=M2LL36_BAUPA|nr:uncharacterized protein BAUCODRAFT_72725 [Baudoinia panamericana UAMH 10762]EMC94987.1 hypothetical protein BAUCODRAFT_72725 [Baudoinia panamericana UAMH 10762]
MEPPLLNGSTTSPQDDSHPTESNDGSPPGAGGQKRQRAKQACEPCRLRKRRCDGNLPCNMCSQFEYKCYFEKHPRKRSKLVEQNEALHDGLVNHHHHQQQQQHHHHPASVRDDRPTLEDATKMRSMEANSGLAFTRLLGLRLDPSSGPKLFTFAWNVGSRVDQLPSLPSITDFLAQDQMYMLAKHYFLNVHPLYGFLDQKSVMEQLGFRWARPDVCTLPDHLFAGIAAMGMLWSDGSLNAALPQIVDLAKRSLEGTSTMQPPCLTDVQSWILRVLYLRSTDHPHAVWMATCTTMHLVESIGIYQETSNSTLHPHARDHLYDPEIRRRVFWVARMLNTWVSFEYGRTRVCLRGITCGMPTAQENDYTNDYINLYSISCCLDPDRTNQAGQQWEDFLKQLEDYEVRHDGIMLSKANLALCGYRRIRLANPTMSSEITNRIINIALKGLEAARRMAERRMPWWHVGNVTFQCICVFLAMDSRESLAHVATAMRTLEEVVERFHTVAMREALKTARFLVRLGKKRKDEDSVVLGQSLRKDGLECDPPQLENLRNEQMARSHSSSSRRMGMEGTPMTTSSGEDWNMDILNNSDFDWNYFLTADMPAFQSFAPEGTM